MGGTCNAHGGDEKYTITVGNPEGERPLGRPRLKLEGNVRMKLTGIGCEGVEWIQMAQDRNRRRVLVDTATSLHVP
jgi:hypothetical protein